MHTEQINHDPAITFFQTGFQLAGRPSIGSWLAYGLGSENKDLPAFVVMISQRRTARRSATGGSPVGQRISADALSGREVPLGIAIRCFTFRIRPEWIRTRDGISLTTSVN